MSEAGASPPQLPPPLKLSCTSADCAKQLHCFRATKKLREANQAGRCRSCGAALIDWSRVHRRDLGDADFTFESLRRELVRHHFWHITIDQKAINHARRKGRKRLLEAAEGRIRQSVGPAAPFHDGYQTPWEGSGNAIYGSSGFGVGARLTDLGPVRPRASALLRRAGAPRGRRPRYRGAPPGGCPASTGSRVLARGSAPPEPRGAGRRCRGSWQIRGWVSGPGGHPEPYEAMKIMRSPTGNPEEPKS